MTLCYMKHDIYENYSDKPKSKKLSDNFKRLK